MQDYIFPNKSDLVNYLFLKLDNPSPIKIQKTLYFLFAYYGATYGKFSEIDSSTELDQANYTKFLFKPSFEAWMYGPVDNEVYDLNKNDSYSAANLDLTHLNTNLNISEKNNIIKFVDNIIEQTNRVDDFTLVDRTHEDKAWSVPYNENKGTLHIEMNPNDIVDEYAENYV